MNNKNEIRWCAIGDSFTYLNDHLDETGYRVTKGYLSRILEKIPNLHLKNIGINGSTFRDWITQAIPEADLYTVLLGTNDWHQGIPIGTETDFKNNARGSYMPEHGQMLSALSAAIIRCCEMENIPTVNCHDLSGFTPENAVRFKRVRQGNHLEDLVYPDYIDISFSPEKDPYPYPIEAAWMTYDGLHPTDDGFEILANLFATCICEIIGW